MKKKALIILCLLFVLVICSCESQLYTGKYVCDFKENEGAYEAIIKTYTGDDEKVVIPETFGKYAVTEIRSSAFHKCSSLKEVEIPEYVNKINPEAFTFCESLEKFVVDEDNNFYTVDEYGVLFDKKMETIVQYPPGASYKEYVIPDSVISISKSAFKKAVNLESVTFPDSLSFIEESAFWGAGLKAVDLSSTDVRSIGKSSFGNTNISEIKLSNKLGGISSMMFYDCDSLTELYLPASIRTIDDYGFEGLKSLKNIYVDEKNEWFSSKDGVLLQWDGVEYNLLLYPAGREQTHYTVPNNVSGIYSDAFSNPHLESVTIPESVRFVSSRAFYECANLSSVTVIKHPKYGIDIEEGAFPENTVITVKTENRVVVYDR